MEPVPHCRRMHTRILPKRGGTTPPRCLYSIYDCPHKRRPYRRPASRAREVANRKGTSIHHERIGRSASRSITAPNFLAALFGARGAHSWETRADEKEPEATHKHTRNELALVAESPLLLLLLLYSRASSSFRCCFSAAAWTDSEGIATTPAAQTTPTPGVTSVSARAFVRPCACYRLSTREAGINPSCPRSHTQITASHIRTQFPTAPGNERG